MALLYYALTDPHGYLGVAAASWAPPQPVARAAAGALFIALSSGPRALRGWAAGAGAPPQQRADAAAAPAVAPLWSVPPDAGASPVVDDEEAPAARGAGRRKRGT